MKISNTIQLDAFMDAVNKCERGVYLRSQYGDVYNLKSGLSKFVAIAELLGEHGDELELFCDDKNDEGYFFSFFQEHSEVMN